MIDNNISESFSSAINSKNNIKKSLINLNAINNDDKFSIYGTKILENLTSKEEYNNLQNEMNTGKEKIATSITNKGVPTEASDSFDIMANNISAISQGGSGGSLKDILSGTAETINTEDATRIGDYMFQYNTVLNTVNMPKVESIGRYAFNNCTNIVEIIAPNLKVLEKNAFTDFYGEKLILENLTQCDGGNFSKTPNLNTFDFPNLQNIPQYFLNNLPKNFSTPKTLSLPKVVSIELNSFKGSSYNNVTSKIILPELKTAKLRDFFGGASGDWTSLIEIYLPKLNYSEYYNSGGTGEVLATWVRNRRLRKISFSAWHYSPQRIIGLIANNVRSLKMLDMRNLIAFTDDSNQSTILSSLTEGQCCLKSTGINTLYLNIFSPDQFPKSTSGTEIRTSYIYKGCSNLKYLIFQGKENIGGLDTSILPSSLLALVFLQDITKEENNLQDISTLPQDMYIYVTDYSYTQLTNGNSIFASKLRKISEYKDLLETNYGLDLTIYPSDEN